MERWSLLQNGGELWQSYRRRQPRYGFRLSSSVQSYCIRWTFNSASFSAFEYMSESWWCSEGHCCFERFLHRVWSLLCPAWINLHNFNLHKKTQHQWRHLHYIQCNPHCPMVCLRIQIQIYPGSSSYSSRSPLRDGPPNYRQHPPLLRLTFQISLASLIQDDYGWPSRNNKSPLFGCVFEQIFAQQ